MYYLFSIDQYTTPFGYFVLRFPSFLVLLTKLYPHSLYNPIDCWKLTLLIYLWFEILFPVMLIFPVSNGTTRLTACFSSILLNTFMGLCLELGLYLRLPSPSPFICTCVMLIPHAGLYTYSLMIAALALLPSTFWDKLLPSFSIYLAPGITPRFLFGFGFGFGFLIFGFYIFCCLFLFVYFDHLYLS